MNKFYEEWDFVDIDGGAWKQGWDIKTSDDEWKETKLKVRDPRTRSSRSKSVQGPRKIENFWTKRYVDPC